jgi:hypothetical protein
VKTWHRVVVDGGVLADWASLASDFETTTGRILELELESGPDGWLRFRVSVDHVFKGSYGTLYPGDAVDQLVQLANDLSAGFLCEEVGSSGWPVCPDHGTHPMYATGDASHRAVWRCPTGRIVASIGELEA